MDRRQFFGVCAAGVGAVALPAVACANVGQIIVTSVCASCGPGQGLETVMIAYSDGSHHIFTTKRRVNPKLLLNMLGKPRQSFISVTGE